MKKLISLFLVFSFLFSFLLVNAEAQRGGGVVKYFKVGTLFQPSDPNDPHLNVNPVYLPNGKIDLTNRSNFEVSDLLKANYLLKMLQMGKVLTQKNGKRYRLSKKTLKGLVENGNRYRLTKKTLKGLVGDQELPVGIVRDLAVDGVPAGSVIDNVSFPGVFLQTPDFLGGEEPADHLKSISLFYYDGSTVVKKVQIPISSRVRGQEMLSSPEFNSRFNLSQSVIVKEYKYPGATITRTQYPVFEDASGYVPSNPLAERFFYYLYLVDVPVAVTVPSGRIVGFGVTAEEISHGSPSTGKFFLTIGKDFGVPEDQDAYVVYFMGNQPLFFETSYGPITLYDSSNILWPAYTRPNIQFTGTIR